MIASEIAIGRRARLCVTPDGIGYFYGTINDFDDDHVLMEMDSGSIILVPWWELVATDDAPKDLDPVDRLTAILMEQTLFGGQARPPR